MRDSRELRGIQDRNRKERVYEGDVQNVVDVVWTMIEMEPDEPFRGGGARCEESGHATGGENGRWYGGTTAAGSGRGRPSGVGGVLGGCSSDMDMRGSDSTSSSSSS